MNSHLFAGLYTDFRNLTIKSQYLLPVSTQRDIYTNENLRSALDHNNLLVGILTLSLNN